MVVTTHLPSIKSWRAINPNLPTSRWALHPFILKEGLHISVPLPVAIFEDLFQTSKIFFVYFHFVGRGLCFVDVMMIFLVELKKSDSSNVTFFFPDPWRSRFQPWKRVTFFTPKKSRSITWQVFLFAKKGPGVEVFVDVAHT